MTATQTINPPSRPSRTETAPRSDLLRELTSLPKRDMKPEAIITQGFRRLAQHYDAPYATLQLDTASGSITDVFGSGQTHDEAWRKVAEGILLRVRYQNKPTARVYRAADGQAFAAFGVPLHRDSTSSVGSLVIVAPVPTSQDVSPQLTALSAQCALLCQLANPSANASSVAPTNSPSPHAGLVKAASHQSLDEMAFTLVNQVKSKTGCEQVSLGIVRGKHVQILSISGLDDRHARSPGWKLIEQAMEECLDSGQLLCHQMEVKNDNGVAPSHDHCLHRRWHEQTGRVAVASIPLFDQGRCVAIVSLRHRPDGLFRTDQLKRIEEALVPMASGLLLLDRAERSLPAHVIHSLRATLRRGWHESSYGRKLACLAACLLMLWSLIGQQTYVVAIPCHVVPAEVRQMTAPFQGVLKSSLVVPGQHVRQGQPLAQLETRDLEVQRERYLAEKRLAEIERNRASQLRDAAAMAKAEAKRQSAQSHLELMDWQLEHATIRAPWDAIILSGDMQPKVGDVLPLGEQLFELAAHDRWAIELKVPEYAAPYLKSKQAGQFTTHARPHDSIGCELEWLEGVATNHAGRNAFLARAVLRDTPPDWMRGGMDGTARIEAGCYPIWWVWLHRLGDTIRLQLWKF